MSSSCVTEKFCLSNKLLRIIINRRENLPVEVFRRSFLKKTEGENYALLCDKGLLSEFYQDPEETTFYDDEGNSYLVRKEKDGYWAYPKSGTGFERIKLEDDDVRFARFENLNFAQVLKTKNKLTGSCSELTKRLFAVGSHKVLNVDVSVVLGFLCSDKIAEKELLSLPARIPSAKTILVLCPAYCPNTASWAKQLDDKKIICRRFDDILNEDFMINFNDVARQDAGGEFQIPAIRQKEKAGYNAHKYKCLDIIEFLDEEVGNRQVRVKISGNPALDIRYSEAALLMFMAIKLKENKGGWVSLNDMSMEGIIPEPNQTKTNDFTRMHRLISDLRKTVKKYASVDLIEGVKGKGQYRISTHQDRIGEPSSNWLKKTYKHTILPAVKAERLKRGNREKNNI